MTQYSGHQTPEYRMAHGFTFATFEDLDDATDEQLALIMGDCAEEPAEPDGCVACRAYVMLNERTSSAQIDAANEAEDYLVPDDLPGFREAMAAPVDPLGLLSGDGVTPANPAEIFAQKVDELNTLVLEVLEGPPIPPKHISMEELAALVVGAEKWVQGIDAQGLDLAPAQQHIKTVIEATIRKVRA